LPENKFPEIISVIRHRFCDQFRREEKGGWEFATLSFPDHRRFGARLHSSSVTGCRFPDAVQVCTDIAGRFRLHSGAGHCGFYPVGAACRVRLLSLAIGVFAGTLWPDRAGMCLQTFIIK